MPVEKFGVAALGELLIDFTPLGISPNGNPIFERNPGGGPANMACAAARLGAKTAFVGKVGADNFGRALRETLEKNGVDARWLRMSQECPTTLAFVHLDGKGDRSFSFYRHGGADTMIGWDDVDPAVLDCCQYFFCSSVLMAEGPSRETSFRMMETARERGVPVVFDPNLRFSLWSSPEEVRRVVLRALPLADIVKVSGEEAVFLAGEERLEGAVQKLRREYRFQALLVTLGAEGCRAYAGDLEIAMPAHPVEAVDTTAAGDSFTGGFLAALLESGKTVSELTREEFWEIIRTANITGGLTASRKGSISALPTRQEVEAAKKRSLSLE